MNLYQKITLGIGALVLLIVHQTIPEYIIVKGVEMAVTDKSPFPAFPHHLNLSVGIPRLLVTIGITLFFIYALKGKRSMKGGPIKIEIPTVLKKAAYPIFLIGCITLILLIIRWAVK